MDYGGAARLRAAPPTLPDNIQRTCDASVFAAKNPACVRGIEELGIEAAEQCGMMLRGLLLAAA